MTDFMTVAVSYRIYSTNQNFKEKRQYGVECSTWSPQKIAGGWKKFVLKDSITVLSNLFVAFYWMMTSRGINWRGVQHKWRR
jgi:putative IMPACT (imprinted ancient) family translation regulator